MNMRPLTTIRPAPTCALLALFAMASTGCSIHQAEEEPIPLIAGGDRYREATSAVPVNENMPRSEGPWWLAFGDPTLDALVREALSSNLDLERTAALITQAAAVLRQVGARLFPTVDADASYVATWTERSGDGPIRNGRRSGDEHDEIAGIGLSLAWELDVWGGLRAAKRAAELDLESAKSDREAARLLLSASVVETYFEILEQRLQIALINQQIDTNTTLLDLTRLRFGQGQSSIVDVLQQREQLASTRALVPAAQSRLDELGYALDVLLGGASSARRQTETESFPDAPDWPRLGVPSELLTERPDLQSARRRVVAIDHLVGEAIADRLPSFGVGASVTGLGDLRPDTLVASALGDLIAPVFDAGARAARVDFRRAELHEAVASWSNAYLIAVREVETAVALERGQVERVRLQEEQLAIAQQLLRETRNHYSQGQTDYLPVLAALATQQDLERELITSRRARLSLRVGLHRALGGPMPREESGQKTEPNVDEDGAGVEAEIE